LPRERLVGVGENFASSEFLTLQRAQYGFVGVPRSRDKVTVRLIDNCHKTDVAVFTVQGAPGHWFIDIFEPMGSDKNWIISNRAQVAGIGGAAFAFSARTDEPLPE
jgi:hypothetical protein